MYMTSSQLPANVVLTMSLVLGRNTQRVCQTINHWLACSGPEWTVARLKALRVAALQLKAGSPAKARQIFKANSIAYFRGTNLPRGPMKIVVEGFVSSVKPSNVKAWDAVLRCYTAIRLTKPSPAQISKAKMSITGPYTGNVDALRQTERELEKMGRELRPFVEPLDSEDLTRLKMFTSTYQVGADRHMLNSMPYAKAAASLTSSGKWPERVASDRTARLAASGEADYVRQFRATLWETSFVYDASHTGEITILQEAGCKARVVAKPNAWCQWFFEPLHRCLHRLQQWFETSVVDCQVDGAYWLLDHIRQGRQLYCFDLSSATDRFPRSLQTAVLRGLGLDSYAGDLDDLCKSWKGLDGSDWDYAVGQPMGLYASFPLFHLTHLLLLQWVVDQLRKQGRKVMQKPFRVLGDDVVIADKAVAAIYSGALRALGVDISEAKSVSSDKLAEFAGFVVWRTNRNAVAYRPYKYGSRPTGIHSPVNVLASFGRRVRKLGPTWARYFERYQRTRYWRHPDLSPMVDFGQPKGGVQPPVLDTTRLENLLMAFCEDQEVFNLNSPMNPWCDPEDIGWAYAFGYKDDMLQRAARQLLGKQLPGESLLLSTPTTETNSESYPSPDVLIASDPLMRVCPNKTDLLTVDLGLSKEPQEEDDPPPPHLTDLRLED